MSEGDDLDHGKDWAWLLDVERTCALLIGRCLGGMLVGSPLSQEEKDTAAWLNSPLFINGIQSAAAELGMYAFTQTTLAPCIIYPGNKSPSCCCQLLIFLANVSHSKPFPDLQRS